jgi:acyl-CoA dehydrogenase
VDFVSPVFPIAMSDKSYLDWPFFEERHRKLERELDAWAAANLRDPHGSDVDAACRTLVGKLGAGGWPRHAIGGTAYGAVSDVIDTRAICLIRETLARHSGLADFAFAMQGLGSGAITLYGTEEQKRAYLPRAASGEAIAAFALSEPDAGSDVAALNCAAREDGDAFVLNGEKTWISNGGIADFYVVFARTGEGEGSRGISAFIVDAGVPGFSIAERIEVIAPHPLARLRFTNCRIPKSRLLGAAGEGFKIAMRNLDVFRTSVAAAALGFARRALDEALKRATTRGMFRHAGRFPAHPGEARADGDGGGCFRAPDLPRRLAARPGQDRHARGGHGEIDRNRGGPARHRCGGADVGRTGSRQRAAGRAALSRDPRAAHLRGCERGAAIDRRTRAFARGESLAGRGVRPMSHEIR